MRYLLLMVLIGSLKFTVGQTATDFFIQAEAAYKKKNYKTALKKI